MDKPHYLQHRKRLKERFIKAPHAVPDAEVIELLLGYVIKGRDVKPQSKELLTLSKTLNGLFSAKLSSVDGVGPEVELFFELIKEFFARTGYESVSKETITLDNTNLVYNFLKHKIGHSKKENFAIIFLNIKNKLISYKVVREGLLSSVTMSVRDIIEEAVKNNATSVIISHNHPSGDCTPSKEDIAVTKQIATGLQYTGISFLDHIIVSSHEYHSMRANDDF